MALPTSIELRIDPSAGDDDNRGGFHSPIRTLKEALRRCERGWRTVCRISLGPGSHALGDNPNITVPAGVGVRAEPLLLVGDTEDSGLGNREAVGGTTGGGSTFPTVVDAVGGLVVDAYRGFVVRFVAGNPVLVDDTRHMIASNTADTLTLVGALPAVPAPGDRFVIERPASSITWTGDAVLSGTVLGLADVRLDGPGGDVYFQLVQLGLYINNVWFTGMGTGPGLTVGPSAAIKMFASAPRLFSDVATTRHPGAYFNAGDRGRIGVLAGGTLSVGRSVWNNVATGAAQPGAFIQCLRGAAFGRSHFRVQNGALVSLRWFRFADVSSAPPEFGVGHATVLVASNSVAYLEEVDLSNCARDPVAAYDGSVLTLRRVSGTGNVGPGAVGVRLRRGSTGRNHGENRLTATLGDVQIGANPAVSTWATVRSLTTDQVAVPSEFCQIGPQTL